MTELYNTLNISKQAHHKYQERSLKEEDLEELCIQAIEQLREMHPKMGAKKMFHILALEGMGRDNFLRIYIEAGFNVRPIKNYRKTTYTTRSHRFKNLLTNIELTDVNLVWTSDISYWEVNGKFYYLIFIIDVYSRRIIGHHVHETLHAEGNVKCLHKALKTRGMNIYENLIHHSDRGVQYASHEYTELLERYHISISMCSSAYENAHIERVNGIIKNEYLYAWSVKDTYEECQRALDKAVDLYNNKRPHMSLDMKTPTEYETYLLSVPLDQRKRMKIYTELKTNFVDKNMQLNLDL